MTFKEWWDQSKGLVMSCAGPGDIAAEAWIAGARSEKARADSLQQKLDVAVAALKQVWCDGCQAGSLCANIVARKALDEIKRMS